MPRFALKYISISLLVHQASSDILGARFPSPRQLSGNDSFITNSWKNITTILDEYLYGNRSAAPVQLSGTENLTFSAGLFSIHDPTACSFQYHYTSDEVKNGAGIHQVDGNSIYRVASVSKLFTVLASQIAFTNGEWDRPLTDFVAGLTQADLDAVGNDPARNIAWKDVSLRALANQISGVPRAAQPYIGDISLQLPDPGIYGLPPLNPIDPLVQAPCLTPELLTDPFAACPSELYLDGNLQRPPVIESWQTPAYSNNGFILLGIALANITGKPIKQVYPDLLFGPLEMLSSYSDPPPQSEWSRAVIPGQGTFAWGSSGGLSISSGGMFSTLNDLAKFSTAIMNSTLIPRNKTREWIHPTSHTASLQQSVGAPWEIYRYAHQSTGAVTDIYTKIGDSGNFTSLVVLIPDYDAGFNIISAWSNSVARGPLTSTIADIIGNNLIPALETQAAVEATENYAGCYRSNDASLNSSITISYNDSASDPGLYITQWVSNGTDMMSVLPDLFGTASLKLQPTIQKPEEVAFRVMPGKEQYLPGTFLGLFSELYTVNIDWLSTDAATYGGAGIGHFIFNIDTSGKAKAVELLAWRVKLMRVD